MVVEVLGRKFY